MKNHATALRPRPDAMMAHTAPNTSRPMTSGPQAMNIGFSLLSDSSLSTGPILARTEFPGCAKHRYTTRSADYSGCGSPKLQQSRDPRQSDAEDKGPPAEPPHAIATGQSLPSYGHPRVEARRPQTADDDDETAGVNRPGFLAFAVDDEDRRARKSATGANRFPHEVPQGTGWSFDAKERRRLRGRPPSPHRERRERGRGQPTERHERVGSRFEHPGRAHADVVITVIWGKFVAIG